MISGHKNFHFCWSFWRWPRKQELPQEFHSQRESILEGITNKTVRVTFLFKLHTLQIEGTGSINLT